MTENSNESYDDMSVIVKDALIRLHGICKMYESKVLFAGKTGKPRTGISALADELGISRSNLNYSFSPKTKKIMSTSSYIKLVQHLDLWSDNYVYVPFAELDRQNVTVSVSTPRDAILLSLFRLIAM
jgi:hypothetical protein